MPMLKNWYFTQKKGGEVIAHGYTFGHVLFSDWHEVHTSPICRLARFGRNGYGMETASGNQYLLEEHDMKLTRKLSTMELMGTYFTPFDSMGFPEDEFLRLRGDASAQKTTLDNAKSWASEQLRDGEMVLLMSNLKVLDCYFKSSGEVSRIEPKIHVGMFQDSVLLMNWVDSRVDLRFFPANGSVMEPYRWSDGLECIYIHNLGKETIYFKGTKELLPAPSQEITRITRDKFRGENVQDRHICEQ